MLSDIDLADWKPEDFPQPMEKLCNLDVFSFLGNDTERFRFLGFGNFGEAMCSTTKEPLRYFLFPRYLKVIKWSK